MLSTLLTFIFRDAGCRSGTRESTVSGSGASVVGSGTRAHSLLGPGASTALGARESERASDAAAAAAAAGRAERAAGAGRGRRGAPRARRGAGQRGWLRRPRAGSPRWAPRVREREAPSPRLPKPRA